MTTQPSDVEIAQSHNLRPIAEIAAKAGIPSDAVIPYGTTTVSYTHLTLPTKA